MKNKKIEIIYGDPKKLSSFLKLDNLLFWSLQGKYFLPMFLLLKSPHLQILESRRN